MIKTVTYEEVDKSALRKKGWKLFAVILSLQLIFLILGYALQMWFLKVKEPTKGGFLLIIRYSKIFMALFLYTYKIFKVWIFKIKNDRFNKNSFIITRVNHL